MTKEEAVASIKTLCNTCELFPKCVNEKPECFKAIELAISALQAQGVPDTNIGDMISRQAAIDAPFKKFDMATGVTWIPLEYIEKLPSAQPEPQWIPCSERLPEVGKDVMVCYDFKGHRSVLIGVLYGDEKFHGYDDEYLTPEGRKYRKAVAWMPLPESYSGE